MPRHTPDLIRKELTFDEYSGVNNQCIRYSSPPMGALIGL